MNWTKDKIEELRGYAEWGMSSGQIGALMGLTRNAVIGKLHREGISLAPLPSRGSKAAPKRAKRPSKPKPRFAKPLIPPLKGRMGAGPAVLAVMPYHCEWPIGDPTSEDFHFCSERRDPLAEPPYCRKHTESAFRRS